MEDLHMSSTLLQSLVILLGAFSVALSAQLLARLGSGITASYRIAILGLPNSGKTALVTAIFDYIFSSSSGKAFTPVGERTIRSINQQISLIESRKTFDRTREQDIFLFRFLYYIKNIFFPLASVKFEGEVVDFPGEMSHRLFESSQDNDIGDDIEIFDRSFYTWIVSSKAHIFTVDVAAYLSAPDSRAFAANRSSEIRRTWQILSEKTFSGKKSKKGRIALVFTKADLLYIIDKKDKEGIRSDSLNMTNLGYNEIPPKDSVDYSKDRHFAQTRQRIEFDFQSLLVYFLNQPCTFELFYCAAYKDINERRLGIEELTRFLLPKSNVF